MKNSSCNDLEILLRSGYECSLYTACAARIVYKNSILFWNTYGVLDPRTPDQKVSRETLFDLASLTKTFVATLFMHIVELGSVDIDSPVCEVLEDLKGDANREKITFRHLLSHTSGLPASFNLYENQEWNKGKKVVVKKLLATDLINEPGQKVVYSCLGFMMLGICIEIITGESLDENVKKFFSAWLSHEKLLYKPQGKTNNIAITTFSRPNRGELIAGVVHDGNAIALDEGISGNAGLFGTVDAVSKLGELYLTKSVLSPLTIKRMTSLEKESDGDRWGLGWKLHTHKQNNPGRILSNSAYGHTGFTGTSLWIDPEKDLVLTLLTNSVHYYNDKMDASKFNQFRYNFHKAAIELLCKIHDNP